VDIEQIMVDRPFPQGRADQVEVGPVALTMGVERRLMARRGKALPAPAAQERGIQAAAEVQVEREALHQQTVVPDCLCRSSVAIFTGAVVAADPATLATEETEVSAAVVEVRLAQQPEERD
jgi:hypothetical protein